MDGVVLLTRRRKTSRFRQSLTLLPFMGVLMFSFVAMAPLLANENSDFHVVYVVGEHEYGSHDTMPAFAKEMEERFGFKTTVVESFMSGVRDPQHPDRPIPPTEAIPNLEVIKDADLIVLFIRFRIPPQEQFDLLQEYFDAGKPAVALRTTSHGFWHNKGWFPIFFGGHYKTHASNDAGTTSLALPSTADHPILRGVERSLFLGEGGVYNAQPLSDTATPLLLGKTGDLPAEPIAWVNRYKPDSRIFYTSLGTRDNFKQSAFRTLLANSILWALGKEVPPGGVLNPESQPAEPIAAKEIPPPPKMNAPDNATILFDGKDLSRWKHWDPSVDPKAISIDTRADSTVGGPVFVDARWKVIDGATEAAPGYGDILTRESFGHYHLHLDFLLPEEPEYFRGPFRGASGVYLSGKYEIQILDSYGQEANKTSGGAIYGFKAPDKNACQKAGIWQSMDIEYRQYEGQPARISVSLNEQKIHDNVEIATETLYGFRPPPQPPLFVSTQEDARKLYDMGFGEFTLTVRFKTTLDRISLVSKSPPGRDWGRGAKALSIRRQRLTFSPGTRRGGVRSAKLVSDGKWHEVAVIGSEGKVQMYVDGKLEAESEVEKSVDGEDHVLQIAPRGDGRGELEVAEVRFYRSRLLDEEIQALEAGKEPQGDKPVLHWKRKPLAVKSARDQVAKGPIRLQSDASKVRFSNIWIRPLD